MIMRCLALLLVVIAGLLVNTLPGRAQSPQPQADLAALQTLSEEKDQVIADLSQQLRTLRSLSDTDRSTINDASTRALASYYEGLISVNDNGNKLRLHQQAVFAWQLLAANVLLGVVVLVSVSGVLFAGYEMIVSRRLIAGNAAAATGTVTQGVVAPEAADPPAQAPDPGAASPLGVTTIVLEPTKIHITSAVIGIVILTLSLAFLYLFLREVYAINVIDITDRGVPHVISTKNPGTAPEATSPPTP